VIVALEAAAVSVVRGGVPIVRSVDLAVSPGDWLSVIGANGAGKSTLLGALAGVIPSSGSIRVHGMALAGLGRRARARAIALVPQAPRMPPGVTVEQYVLLGRTAHLGVLGRESPADLAAVQSAVQRLHLVPLARRQMSTLSGGERQRAVLARAVVQEAPILMLDEPTTSLDIGFQQEVLDLVDELRHALGLTVISTMHDLTLCAQYADRLAVLAHGEIVAAGDPLDLVNADSIADAYGARVEVIEHRGRLVVIPIRRPRHRSMTHEQPIARP
jgi:iron complex transport system ATP-binding protein